MKAWLALFEKIFTMVALIHFSEGFLPLILSRGASEGDSNFGQSSHPLNAGLFVLIYFITYVLLVLRWKKLFAAIAQNLLMAGLLVLVLCSFLWSAYPVNTLIESVRVVAASSFGLYFATRYTSREQLNMLSTVFTIVVCASVVFAILPPRFGIMGGIHAGAWRGVFVHKNHFGLIMAVSAMTFLMQWFDTKKKRFKWLIPLSLFLLLLSKSTGALAVALVAITMLLFYYSYISLRLGLISLVPIALFLVTVITLGGMWFSSNLELVAATTGKDLTLTGRTVFWQILWDMVLQNPLVGYGYKGFWYGLNGPSRDVIQIAMWTVPEAHNGFLEMALNLGLGGLGLFFLGYFLTLLRSVRWLHLKANALSTWPLVFLNVLIVCNLAESSLMGFGFFWLLYSSISFSLPLNIHRVKRERRLASSHFAASAMPSAL